MIIRPHDPNGENPAARPLQLRRSDILQPGTSVPGTLPHRDHAPIGRNLTVTKRKRPRWLRIWPLLVPATTGVYPERSRRAPHTLACSTIGAAGIDATGHNPL